jgi:glycosyltransferase involved in cell wall biosynthesis
MKVSVVIPAFNEEAYIGACLESFMHQKVKPDEIIVVNNNSSDNTVKIIKKYSVLLVNEKKQGMIPARNRGFNEAKYDIIARTDADTIVPPDWIKNIKTHFKNKNIIALTGPADFYDQDEDTSISNYRTKVAVQALKSYLNILKSVLNHDCLFGPNYALRKDIWDKIKNEVCLDDKAVHEDIDISIHLAPLGIIKFDKRLVVSSSLRRWKNVDPYFEYPYRTIKSIQKHKQIALKKKGKQLVRRFVEKSGVMY